MCAFRKRFLKEIEALFVQVLRIARQMKLLKLGTIALDGTKIHANASRHSALSYGHAHKIEAQLEAEVKQMLVRAAVADQEPLPEGLSIPDEIKRREDRLAAIRQAKAQIEARAVERDAQEKADFDAKMKAREDKAARTGKKPGGKPPKPPALTEPASAVERMKHKLKTVQGRKLYGLRKQTVEPVFGIIKSVMRFRQFMLRGLSSVCGEWSLVAMAWNFKRMAVMAA